MATMATHDDGDGLESDLEDDFDDALGGNDGQDFDDTPAQDFEDGFGTFADGKGDDLGTTGDGDDFGDFEEEGTRETEGEEVTPPSLDIISPRLYLIAYPPDTPEGARMIRQSFSHAFPAFLGPDLDQGGAAVDPVWRAKLDAALIDLPRAPYMQPSSELVTRGDGSTDELYRAMTVPQELEPLDWKRSIIYRKQMIALGLPVNLDEVLPRAKGKRLGPLVVKMQETTAKNGWPAGEKMTEKGIGGAKEAGQIPAGDATEDTLPSKPEVDIQKVAELCSMPEDQCARLSLSQLQTMADRLEQETSSLSLLIMHALRERESLIQEGKDYNVMISDLVGWAAQAAKAQSKSSSRSVSGMRSVSTNWDNRQSVRRESESETSRGSALLSQRRGSTAMSRKSSLSQNSKTRSTDDLETPAKRSTAHPLSEQSSYPPSEY